MRVLLLADIHGNWPALQAVQETHDVCVCLGDLVDYGLEPGPCIDWVREHAHYCIRGNHDHAVAQRVHTNGKTGFKYLSGVTRRLTWELVEPEHRHWLGTLPVRLQATLGTVRFLFVHATPRDPLDEYANGDANVWKSLLHGVEADVICVGHTHKPYVLKVGGKTVINPGSVGQPRDGNPNGSYAIWEDGKVELKRFEYDVEETVRTLEASSLPEQAKRMSSEVFRTGTYKPSTNES